MNRCRNVSATGLACDREHGHAGSHRGYVEEHDEVVFWGVAPSPLLDDADRWMAAAWFAAKARNLRALRGRVRAGESPEAVADDYGVPVAWVVGICADGFGLLGGEA